ARFAGATPPTTNPTTGGPPPTTPGGGTCTAAAWNSGTAYTGGALVSYNGHTYKAAWWTQGETPGTAAVWVDQGACSGGGTTQPPTCPAAWNAGTAYNGGATVSYGGHKWTAKWWTQGDIPGNNGQGVWTDNGACGGGTTSPPPGGCPPAWNATTVNGNTVSYNGHKWTAKWWTQGDTPGGSAGVWTDNGPC